MNFIWEAIVTLSFGFCLIRIVGKKTVSEMTGPEIVTLLSIGSVIGHAISEFDLWKTILTISIFGALLMSIQYLGLKFNWIEKIFMGKATIVIEDGQVIYKNLKKMRMTVDQLETKLRQKGITSFSDLRCATVEMNGRLGYELKRNEKPVTIGELDQLLARLQLIPLTEKQSKQTNIFDELLHHRHHKENPKNLQ